MNTSLWESLIKTALLGTERAPLPEPLVRQASVLGLVPSDEPAQTLLELLAATHLMRKAAFSLASADPLPTPAELTPSAAFAPQLVSSIEMILAGVYPRALDDLLGLLANRGWSLPPETLPALLDRAVRDGAFWEKIRPAIGPRGAWLAAQNPAWSALLSAREDDWDTGAFPERLRWLQKTRMTNPLLALAALEKSWRTERPEHKRLFLQTFSTRLSVLDEDFLEKILTSDRTTRQTALHLLLQMPDGQRRQAILEFFRARIAGVFSPECSGPTLFLEKQLPDLSEQPAALLVTLLTPEEIINWRPGLVVLLARLLPPAEIAAATAQSSAQLLAHTAAEPALTGVFPAMVHAAVTFRDADWLEAVARFLEEDPHAPIWKNAPASLALQALPDERRAAALIRLLQHENLLDDPGSPLVAALRIDRRPWPRAVLLAFLTQVVKAPFPQPHLRDLLENAAYQCIPADAESAQAWLDPEKFPAWRTELAQFFDAVHFRRRLWNKNSLT